MDKKKYVIKDTFEVANYIGLSKIIADGFFPFGEYLPSEGKINAMRLYFNICVQESPFEFTGNVETDKEMNEILADEEFTQCFLESMAKTSMFELTFANAYYDALEVVETRKSSLSQVVDTIKNSFGDLLESITDTLNPDSITKLENMIKEANNINLSDDKVVQLVDKKHFK